MITCNLGVLDNAEREVQKKAWKALLAACEKVELENGFEFRFMPNRDLLSRVADLLYIEVLCCGFSELRLIINGNHDARATFSFTGPPGTKAALAAQLELITAS